MHDPNEQTEGAASHLDFLQRWKRMLLFKKLHYQSQKKKEINLYSQAGTLVFGQLWLMKCQHPVLKGGGPNRHTDRILCYFSCLPQHMHFILSTCTERVCSGWSCLSSAVWEAVDCTGLRAQEKHLSWRPISRN